jgi:regulator of ribonuclease activity B
MLGMLTMAFPTIMMGLFGWLGRSKKPDLDEAVLAQLRQAGSNLTKPHEIEFFLYFPMEAVAHNAAEQIRRLGFDVAVRPAAQGPGWLCFAKKTMVPVADALQELRRGFNTLAVSLGGKYDGWGTGVVK